MVIFSPAYQRFVNVMCDMTGDERKVTTKSWERKFQIVCCCVIYCGGYFHIVLFPVYVVWSVGPIRRVCTHSGYKDITYMACSEHA